MLNFDIIGGCDDLDIELNLSELGNITKLEPENYSYNSSTKIRHVQKTLSQVTLAHQGFYNLTMTHFNVNGTPTRDELSISLTVNGKILLSHIVCITLKISHNVKLLPFLQPK